MESESFINKKNRQNKQIHIRVTTEEDNQIKRRAEDLGMNVSEYILDLVSKDLAGIVSDESAILYRYEELKRQVSKVDAKTEELGQLFLAYLTAFFRTQPPLYSEEDTENLDWGKANETTVQWLTVHRNKLRKDNKPFMYRIFGNMLEVDGTFQSKDEPEIDRDVK